MTNKKAPINQGRSGLSVGSLTPISESFRDLTLADNQSQEIPSWHDEMPAFPPNLGTTTEFAAISDSGGSYLVDKDTGEITFQAKKTRDRQMIKRFYLQQAVGRLLFLNGHTRERVTYCCRHLGHESETVKIRKGESGHKYHGLAVCADVWKCPVCAALIQERRGDEIREAMEWAASNNKHVAMVTLTTSHKYSDDIQALLESMTDAWRKVTSWRNYKELKKYYGLVGYIRALEVTHGSNGFHPHFHILFFTDKELGESFRSALSNMWIKYFDKQGLSLPSAERGVDLRDGKELGDYLNKFAEGLDHITWDIADEISKQSSKSGKGKGKSIWQLVNEWAQLRDYMGKRNTVPTKRASQLTRIIMDYFEAFKGKSQLQWSRGFKKSVGITDKSDEEIAAEKGESVLVYGLNKILFSGVLKNNLRGDLIDRLDTGMSYTEFCNYLARQNKTSTMAAMIMVNESTQRARTEENPQEDGLLVDKDGDAIESDYYKMKCEL